MEGETRDNLRERAKRASAFWAPFYGLPPTLWSLDPPLVSRVTGGSTALAGDSRKIVIGWFLNGSGRGPEKTRVVAEAMP